MEQISSPLPDDVERLSADSDQAQTATDEVEKGHAALDPAVIDACRSRTSWSRPQNLAQTLVHAILFAAYETSFQSMEELLNATGPEQDRLTQRWRDYKLRELHFVGITGALIAALFGGAFSWYNASTAAWEVLALWYCGLLFTIASIGSATQQSITLYRFSALSDAERIIRAFLRRKKDRQGRWEPRRVQAYVWQAPVMLLRFGIILFLIGLLVLLWTSIHNGPDDYKIAVVFTVFGAVLVVNHGFCTFSVYSRCKD